MSLQRPACGECPWRSWCRWPIPRMSSTVRPMEAEVWQAGRLPLTRACLPRHRAKHPEPRLALVSPGGVAYGAVRRLDGFRTDLESDTGRRGSVAYGVGGRIFHLRCKPTKADHRQTTLDNEHLLWQVVAMHLASFLALDWMDLLACCGCSWFLLGPGLSRAVWADAQTQSPPFAGRGGAVKQVVM